MQSIGLMKKGKAASKYRLCLFTTNKYKLLLKVGINKMVLVSRVAMSESSNEWSCINWIALADNVKVVISSDEKEYIKKKKERRKEGRKERKTIKWQLLIIKSADKWYWQHLSMSMWRMTNQAIGYIGVWSNTIAMLRDAWGSLFALSVCSAKIKSASALTFPGGLSSTCYHGSWQPTYVYNALGTMP